MSEIQNKITKGSIQSKTSKNLRLAILIAVVVIISISLAGYKMSQREAEKDTANTVTPTQSCAAISQEIDDVAGLLISNERRQLQALAEKIKSIDNHDRDPNCLIPLIAYHLVSSDTQTANDYITKLEVVGDEVNISRALKRNPSYLEAYRSELNARNSITTQLGGGNNGDGIPIHYPDEPQGQ